jgi:hypothetical protein
VSSGEASFSAISRPGLRLRALAILLAFGATGGTLLDMLHTFSGTTEYTTPLVLRTAWWVSLLFAGAYGVGGYLYALAHRRMGGPREVSGWPSLLVGLCGFAALCATSAFLPATHLVKLGLLAAGAAVLWGWLDRSWRGVALAALTAVIGSSTEIALSRAGVFRYLDRDLLGIPMWLPALYLASAPSFGQLARRVVRHAR